MAQSHAIDRAAPRLVGTSPGDSLQQSESGHHHDRSRSSRTGSYGDRPGNWVCDRSAADTIPSIAPGSIVGSAANHELADSPAEKSAVSTRQGPGNSWTSCLQRQHTAERAQIPGKDGGCLQKVPVPNSNLDPAPQTDQSPLRPSAYGGWIGQVRRIFAVRCRLLGRIPGGDVLTGLLPAPQGERRRRREPIGQGREGFSARPTNATPHPNALVPVILGRAEPPSVADDRMVSAESRLAGRPPLTVPA